MNLASGEVNVELIANRIGGPLDAVGGHRRPDTVLDATTHDPLPRESLQKGGSDAPPWQIIGGSHGPDRGQARPPTRPERTRETTGIERFQLGIVALGGRRFSSDGGTSSDNEVELDLLHLRLGTEGREAADFLFAGVLTLGQFSASDENTVRLSIICRCAGHGCHCGGRGPSQRPRGILYGGMPRPRIPTGRGNGFKTRTV